MGTESTPFLETNPVLWVQLREETCHTNATILEAIQELKSEMAWLWVDNERLMQEQEKIINSLYDWKNQ